jgi:hypothetical protein
MEREMCLELIVSAVASQIQKMDKMTAVEQYNFLMNFMDCLGGMLKEKHKRKLSNAYAEVFKHMTAEATKEEPDA